MANINNSIVLEILMHQATKEAYENAYEWMESDTTISSQLRDGVRTVRNSFSEIDNSIEDVEIILMLMQERLKKVLNYYQQLPGDYGQWECSALNIVNRNIAKMINEKYAPTAEEISAYEAENSI